MDSRKQAAGSQVCQTSSFLRQPPRVLIVDALPPWWSETGAVLCEALDNFLSLACSLDGPCRIPLLSLYAISRQQECLLPFVQLRGNMARLRSCVEELRSLPGEGCVRGPARGAELLQQAVLDSLQQFKQYGRHASAGQQGNDNCSVEVTVVTSQPGQGVVSHLEAGLKGADLVSLRRLLVVQISTAAGDWGNDSPSPEDTYNDDCLLMLGTEIDLLRVDNSVVAVETMLKAWLHAQGNDREHLRLLLPASLELTSANERPSTVCVKCDVQERLLSPALLSLATHLGAKTESARDFPPPAKGSSNQNPPLQTLRAVKAVCAEAVCESVLYGLPLVLRPTSCWQLEWDDMEANHSLFHALCHTLRSRDLFLLVKSEPAQNAGVHCYYILQSSPSLTILMKPVVSRELFLPCTLPVSNQDPSPDALHTIQGCLSQLEEDSAFNPLTLSSNVYQHLKTRGLLSRPLYPYRVQQAANKAQVRPLDGTRATCTRVSKTAPRPSAGSQQQGQGLLGAPPLPPLPPLPGPKAARPPLTLLATGGRRAPHLHSPLAEEDEGEDDRML